MYKRLLIISLLSANLILLISCADDQARIDIADTNTKLSQIQAKIGVINTKITNQKMIDIINKQDDLQNKINQLNNQYSTLNNQVKSNQELNKQLFQGMQQQIDSLRKQKEKKDIQSNTSVDNQQQVSDVDATVKKKFEKARLDIKNHNFDDAVSELKDIIDNYDSKSIYVIDSNYFLSVTYAALEKYNEAITTANDFVNHYPDNQYAADALMTIYICQNQLGNKDKAKSTANLILENYPDSEVAKKLKSLQ